MAFVAVNAEVMDSQLALQQSLHYEEQRAEYEEILKLCKEDTKAAWKRLSALLDGDIFSQGPSFRYQPAIGELQKSCLELAYELAIKEDPAEKIRLAMETLEWFPNEPLFWLNLADTLEDDSKELVAKRLALTKACSFLSSKKRYIDDIRCIGNILGRIDHLKPCERHKLESLPQKTVQKFALKIKGDPKLSNLLAHICELAEEILECSPTKRSRPLNHGSSIHKAHLSTPITIAPTLIESSLPAETADASLMLSQPASIPNLHDYSQPSSFRSQSKRLRAKEINSAVHGPEARHTVKDLKEFISLTVSSVASGDKTREIFGRAKDFYDEQSLHSGSEADPNSTLWNPVVVLPQKDQMTLYELIRWVLDFTLTSLEQYTASSEVIDALGRFECILVSNIDFFLHHGSMEILLWLAERRVFYRKTEGPDIFSLLHSCLLSKSQCSLNATIRLLWLEYHHGIHREDNVKLLELLFSSIVKNSIMCIGALGGSLKGWAKIDRETLERCQQHLKRADLLDEAMLILGTNDADAWIENHIDDFWTWLTELYKEDIFFDLALAIFRNSQVFETRCIALALAFFKTLFIENERLEIMLTLIAGDADFFVALASDSHIFDEMLKRNTGHELFLCLFSTIKDKHIALGSYELLFTLTRDFIIGEKQHLKDLRLLLLIKDVIDSIGQKEEIVCAMEYAVLSFIHGVPLLGINDQNGIIRSFGEDRANVGIVPLDLSASFRLFKSADHLAAFDNLDLQKSLTFVESLLPALFDYLETDKHYCFTKRLFLHTIATPIDRKPRLAPISVSDNERRISEILAKKIEMYKKAHPNRKKSTENIPLQRQELTMRICVEGDEEERYEQMWQLGNYYDAELHLILSKDVSTLFGQSREIRRLVEGCYNCWRLALPRVDYDALRFGKFVSLVKSITRGVLSIFVNIEDVTPIALTLLNVINQMEGGRAYRYLYAKGFVSELLHKDPSMSALIYVSSLTLYLTADRGSNPEVIYDYCCRILERLFVINDPSTANRVYQTFLEAIRESSHVSLEVEANYSGENLLTIASQLSKLDKRKTHHFHLYLQAKYGMGDRSEQVVHRWGKLLPCLVKSKSGALISVWQSDNDYPGDYLWYAEKYVIEAAHQLADCSDVSQAVPLIAMLLGRVAGPNHNIIRVRHVLMTLLRALKEACDRASTTPGSLVDFAQPEEESRRLVDEIYADASSLVQAHGVKIENDQ